MLIPTLETERLVLRGWRESDLDAYFELRGDPVASQFIGGALSRDDTWRNMAAILGHWVLRGYGAFAIEEKATREFVGYTGPWFPLGFPEPEIGYSLVPSAHGRGLITEATKRARTFAYETLAWQTAVSFIAPENLPSLRVAARLKCTLDGTTELRGKLCQIWRHPPPAT